MTIISFSEWLPDQPALGGGATVASGVVAAANGYRPLPSLMAAPPPPLASTAQGAFAGRDPLGAGQAFVGTATKLFQAAGAAWTDVTKGGGTYDGGNEAWEFTQYGSLIIATNGADPVQSFRLGTSTAFADLAAAAPVAKHVASVRDWVFLGDTNDPTNGSQPGRVCWSAIDDPTNWPTPGTLAAAELQSDYQILPEGGAVRAIVGGIGGLDGAIFMDQAIYRVMYEGPPTIFGFTLAERQRGALCSGGVVPVGALVYYVAADGFFAFDGAQSRPIGAEKIDRWFFNQLNGLYIDRITAAADPQARMVVWSFPSTASGDGTPDTALIYNWAANRWSTAPLAVDLVFRDLTPAVTLEQLDSYGSLEALPITLDTRAWIGGQLALSAVDKGHQLTRLNGPPMAATLVTGELNGDGQGLRVWVRGIRPLVDGATASAIVTTRDSLTTAPVDTGPVWAGADGICHFRLSTRHARVRIDIPAGAPWSHAIGVETFLRPEGTR